MFKNSCTYTLVHIRFNYREPPDFIYGLLGTGKQHAAKDLPVYIIIFFYTKSGIS